MPQSLALLSYLVRDYDEAIDWFTRILGFELIEDSPQGAGKRWVVVRPPGSASAAGEIAGYRGSTGLLLAQASGPAQTARVGDQSGGRVFLFLETDDFDRDFAAMTARGVTFLEPPRTEPYGKVAVFSDLYGMKWDLLQHRRVLDP
eukprot:gene19932-20441_t